MQVAILLSTVLAAASNVLAEDFVISTGIRDAFNPTSVKAAVGDNIIFNFHQDEHNLVTSPGLASPCAPAPGGYDTDILPNGTNITVPVNSTDPVYFYCAPHCKSKGMVFILNPANSGDVAAYAAAAKSSSADGTAASSSSAAPSSSSSAAGASSSAAPASSSSSSSSAASAPSTSPTTSSPGSASGLQVGVAKGAALLLAGVAAGLAML